MSGDRHKILEMLSEGKITADEAERLLDALDKDASLPEVSPAGGGGPSSGTVPKYLRVLIDDTKDPTKVNIRIPFQLLRAGIKLQSLLPAGARARVNKALDEKGIGFDLNQLTAENVDEFIRAFSEMTVDIDADGGLTKVKVFCE
jgi:SHOCT-like domain